MNILKLIYKKNSRMRKPQLRVAAATISLMMVAIGCAGRDISAVSGSESDGGAPAAVQTNVDLVAGATRYAPLSAEQLTTELDTRSKEYYENAVANGTIFSPPPAGDIAAWKAVNPDTIGWISIANTNISYPVLKGPYTDYYTHKGYYKEYSRNGVIWVDSDTRLAEDGSIASQNTVIYGHNWTNCWRPVNIQNPNDVMFAQLAAYDEISFAGANPYIRLATADGDHMYQIFAVFYTDLSFGYNYADGEQVPNIISYAQSISIHNFHVNVKPTDQIITLSTCTRVMGPGDNQRFVVMAKKIS